ncbi:WD-40 repeat protein [Streptomyces sp. NBRC 110611]|uniref:hypothetical protein n=1 Tax=Streptomyces sp. NBRC 110611 TaxID=1621259 RepID=UPI00082B696D|nr:hypothetical protein [Streptomyces sp. NBRC 110611]GAU65706.1 WD-40 repeat protein [Streptomyces sp. NBRC 110611]
MLVALGSVVAVVAGLLAVLNGPEDSRDSHASRDSPEEAARRIRSRAPFEQALAHLATARGLHYKDLASAGTPGHDITVTPSGTLFGTLSGGAEGLDQDVLRIGGETFTRRKRGPDDEVLPDGPQGNPAAQGQWTIQPGESGMLAPVLARFRPPAVLALELRDAVAGMENLPDPDDPDAPDPRALKVHGVPALRADTPVGRLLVARNKPYRVLRLAPHPENGSARMDLSPVSGDRADAMYDTLEAAAEQLAGAVDGGVDFTLSADDRNVSCGTGGCTVSQNFTGELTSDAKARRRTGGTVTAVMRATVTIDGRDAGGCTSARSTFPLTGDTVSGTLSCSVPGAGPLFAAADAQYQARAAAESRASGGRPVHYLVPCTAGSAVHAVALATGDVDKLVAQVRRERRAHVVPKSGELVIGRRNPSSGRPDCRARWRVPSRGPRRRV